MYVGRYSDCQWCRGKGCIGCEGEARKDHPEWFPDLRRELLHDPTGQELVNELLGKPSRLELGIATTEWVQSV